MCCLPTVSSHLDRSPFSERPTISLSDRSSIRACWLMSRECFLVELSIAVSTLFSVIVLFLLWEVFDILTSSDRSVPFYDLSQLLTLLFPLRFLVVSLLFVRCCCISFSFLLHGSLLLSLYLLVNLRLPFVVHSTSFHIELLSLLLEHFLADLRMFL